MSVTVLVPAHNEAATIGRCVQAIRASTYPISELVVVADACTDDTAVVARIAGADRVVEVNCGDKAEAQNAVLPSITTEIIVGFDADTFPTPTCIKLMLRAMANEGWDAVGGTVLPAQTRGMFIRSRQYAYALGRRHWRIAQSKVGRVQVLTGAVYAFRTQALKAIGGFQSVGISSDMDTTWTFHQHGYRVAYVGDAIAHTIDPETFADYRKQMRRWAAGYFQTMAKHRRQLAHPRAILVVGTALFDLLLLPFGYAAVAWYAVTDPQRVRWYWAWVLGHMLVTTLLAASVIGWKDALLGVVPYTVVNFYNKGLYWWAMIREWVLGIHYAAWTGRHGRAVKFTRRQFTWRRRAAQAPPMSTAA